MRIEAAKTDLVSIVLHQLKCLLMHILLLQHEYKCKKCDVWFDPSESLDDKSH